MVTQSFTHRIIPADGYRVRHDFWRTGNEEPEDKWKMEREMKKLFLLPEKVAGYLLAAAAYLQPALLHKRPNRTELKLPKPSVTILNDNKR
ncbi:hypothetical protein RUM43_007674 [Polyplax serrata]|uniref:Uncharacterized protein n=1 Tax=Polyplax serrata TaxID=468196 RepID=A0AAN8PD25_POLSC